MKKGKSSKNLRLQIKSQEPPPPEITEEEVIEKHFESVKNPQQWVDRVSEEQVDLAKIRMANRGAPLVIHSPLAKEEVLVRELDKLETQLRGSIVNFPQYNGSPPPRVPPPKPWEPFLPGLKGNEGNWKEWEIGGRGEASLNPWLCVVCGVKNRALFASRSEKVENCESCGYLRTNNRDYNKLLGLPKLQRGRTGIAPEAGDRSACFCNVCDGNIELERTLWREHYFDAGRWSMPDEPLEEPREPLDGEGVGRKRTLQRFHFEQKMIYEKEEFNNARLFEFLDMCSDLVSIELGGRGLHDDGAIATAKALHGNLRVSTVNLTANAIGYSGAKAFASLLSLSTSSLMILNLSRNQIGPSGGACLIRSIERNSSLLELHIDFNNIGNFGATQMVKPLSKNTCLLKLGLTANGISGENGDSIRKAMAQGREPSDVARLEILF
mmetsp:Transcript_3899/g.5155  ORF Transcript_3899/g.5155 Transcript_3899/m.5155 type:complete len:439 (-) Transcript_3899:29-1345(-)